MCNKRIEMNDKFGPREFVRLRLRHKNDSRNAKTVNLNVNIFAQSNISYFLYSESLGN